MVATVTEVRLHMTLPSGRSVRPSFYLGNATLDDAVDPSELLDVAAAAHVAVGTSGLMAGFTTGVSFRQAEAQNFHVAPPGTEEPPSNPEGKLVADTITFSTTYSSTPGTRAVDTLPPRNATIYKWNSLTAGTKGRNWTNYPPLGEDEVDSNGVIASARISQLNADIEAVITAAAAASTVVSVGLVVCSRKYDRLEDWEARTIQPNVRTRRRWSSL